jgi:hypothetical protein
MQEMREGSGVSFDGSPEDRERATEGFEEHVREVKESVRPERLLVYEVREGWGPLCGFLGVEAPQGEPFPHLNEGEQFSRLMRRAVRCGENPQTRCAGIELFANRRAAGGGSQERTG